MRFRVKITLCMVSLMSILLGIGGSALISYSFNTSLSQEKTNAKKSYRIVLNTLSILNERSSWSAEEDIPDIFEQLSSTNSWTIVQLSSSSAILYEDGDYLEQLIDLSSQVDETHCAYQVLSISDEDLEYYLQISGVFSLGNELLYLDLAYDISSIYESNQTMLQSYRWIFLIMLLTCALLSWLLAWFLTRPLSQLSRTSRQIANGDYNCRSHISSNDEIGQLSEDFDKMADHLVYHINQIQEAMEQQNLFVGNFTHELKTPMTSIIGYADLLRGHNLSEEDQSEAVQYIYSEGKRLERLSMTLLDIFSLGENDISFSPASPSALIHNLADHYSASYLRQGILIRMDCEEGICMLEPDLFSSLIVNIIENARRAIFSKLGVQPDTSDKLVNINDSDHTNKSILSNSLNKTNTLHGTDNSNYTDKSNNICETSNLSKDNTREANDLFKDNDATYENFGEPNYILISSSMTSDGCRITIGDTGCGIPEDSLAHLTEEFYRVDKNRSRAQGGAGLGLSLCHKIVELHNGSMQFDSKLGVGTVITIELHAGINNNTNINSDDS